LKTGAALFTPASNSFSVPGLTSICAISVTMVFPAIIVCKRHYLTIGGEAQNAHR
jgi:hypothetical protein